MNTTVKQSLKDLTDNTANTGARRAEASPADYVSGAMQKLGLSGLSKIKDAFVGDPGRPTSVSLSADNSYFSVSGDASSGYLVVDSCEGHHRGWTFLTAVGAMSQFYVIASTLATGQVVESQSAISITGNSPLGARSVFISALE
jgi:hypothetical protein